MTSYESAKLTTKEPETISIKSDAEVDDKATSIIQKDIVLEKEEVILEEISAKETSEFDPGYYVVLAAFEKRDNAIKYSEKINSSGFMAEYGYVVERRLYYVYNLHTQELEQANRRRDQFIHLNNFQDTWVFRVE